MYYIFISTDFIRKGNQRKDRVFVNAGVIFKSSGGRKKELFRKNVEEGAILYERWKRSYFESALKMELFRMSVQEGAISEVIFFLKI